MSTDNRQPDSTDGCAGFGTAAADALRYWERRRILYNGLLAAIVAGYTVANWPQSGGVVDFDMLLVLLMLAILANVCYSTAYVADVFVQLSGFREVWGRWRWVLFGVGTVLAAIITRFISMGMCAPRGAG